MTCRSFWSLLPWDSFYFTHDAHIKSYKPVYQFMAWPSGVWQLQKIPVAKAAEEAENCAAANAWGSTEFGPVCGCEINVLQKGTLPKTNSSHLKMGAPWKFGDSYWKALQYVSFGECMHKLKVYILKESLWKTSDCHIIVSNTMLPPKKTVRHSHQTKVIHPKSRDPERLNEETTVEKKNRRLGEVKNSTKWQVSTSFLMKTVAQNEASWMKMACILRIQGHSFYVLLVLNSRCGRQKPVDTGHLFLLYPNHAQS